VPADGVVVKRLAPVRVAELTGVAAGYEPEAITPVIQPLYHEVWQRLCSAGIPAAGPAVAYYEDTPQGILVHAAVPVAVAPGPDHGLGLVDLPEVDSAAAIIHHGPMDDVLPTGQALARWIDANGYRSAGYSREVTLNWCPDPEQWVTELQQPISTTGG
jgi:effector-binding domain-containing protein